MRDIRDLIQSNPEWGAPILERPHILSHRTASHYAKTSDGTLSVTRRQVAEHFGKQHKDVLQSIRNLECSEEFNRLNFQPIKINDLTGESTSHYAMTRDGFTFLVMGFTGKDAARWKEKYIAAFNAMEQRLRANPMPAPMADLSDPGVLLPLLTSYAQRTQVAEGRVKAKGHSASPRTALDLLERTQRHTSKIGERTLNGLSTITPEQLELFDTLDIPKPA